MLTSLRADYVLLTCRIKGSVRGRSKITNICTTGWSNTFRIKNLDSCVWIKGVRP